jgi:cell division protein FtsA
MESRSISRRALDTVVNARLKELFSIIREKFEENDLIHRMHAGIVLVGGGAGMREIDVLVRNELGHEARIGKPINVDGLEDIQSPWSFATIAGALLYSHKTNEEKNLLKDILGRFFK